MAQVSIKQTPQTIAVNINGDTIIINKGCPKDLHQEILEKAQKELK